MSQIGRPFNWIQLGHIMTFKYFKFQSNQSSFPHSLNFSLAPHHIICSLHRKRKATVDCTAMVSWFLGASCAGAVEGPCHVDCHRKSWWGNYICAYMAYDSCYCLPPDTPPIQPFVRRRRRWNHQGHISLNRPAWTASIVHAAGAWFLSYKQRRDCRKGGRRFLCIFAQSHFLESSGLDGWACPALQIQ